jgi:site-specific recombinase XerD
MGRPQRKLARNNRTITLPKLVEGFLFSLQAEGKAKRTSEYYSKPLKHFLKYAADNNWDDNPRTLDTTQIREFLSWAATRTYTFTAGNGTQQVRQAKPSSAWSYFRALRRKDILKA